MDEYPSHLFLARSRDPSPHPPPSPADRTSFGSGLRTKFSAFRDRNTSSIQERLFDKLLQQVLPSDTSGVAVDDDQYQDDLASAFARRPNFTLSAMSHNFRRFNARIGVVFVSQEHIVRLLSWRTYSHTLSFLAIFSFVCLDPSLLCMLPLLALLFALFVPAFVARHPAPPTGPLPGPHHSNINYSPDGPPLAPPPTVQPAKEFSRDFLRNMRDLQNLMDDYCQIHDKVVDTVVPLANFSNEPLSSTLFLAASGACVVMSLAVHLLPWRFLVLVGGWAAILANHPQVARFLATYPLQERVVADPQEAQAQAKSWLDRWMARDIVLDTAPETREVEVFELQRAVSNTSFVSNDESVADPSAPNFTEWEPWLFSPTPYDPLSPARIAGERPRGTRFFEDILPPEGWAWSEKKWALDLWSREWVEERIITGVEVETEGERWVYDIHNENDARVGLAPSDAAPRKAGHASGSLPTWEEGEGNGRRGEWRRRRWVRLVKRHAVTVMTD